MVTARDAQILNLGVNLQNYSVCTELHVDTAEGQRTGEICSFPYNLLLPKNVVHHTAALFCR